jgi:hypothetical protein
MISDSAVGTSRKAAGSIPDGVSELINPSGRTIAPG